VAAQGIGSRRSSCWHSGAARCLSLERSAGRSGLDPISAPHLSATTGKRAPRWRSAHGWGAQAGNQKAIASSMLSALWQHGESHSAKDLFVQRKWVGRVRRVILSQGK